MPVAVGAERAARGENSAGLECDAERTARIERRRRGGEGGAEGGRGGGGRGGAGRGAPWRRLPSTRRVVAAEAVSGKSGGVKERHCQRAAAADKSRGGRRIVVCHLASSDTVQGGVSPCACSNDLNPPSA